MFLTPTTPACQCTSRSLPGPVLRGLLTCRRSPLLSRGCSPLPSFCSLQRGPHFTSSSQPQHELPFSIFASYQHVLLLWRRRGSSGRRGSLRAQSPLASVWAGGGRQLGEREEEGDSLENSRWEPNRSPMGQGTPQSLGETEGGWLRSCDLRVAEQKEAERAARWWRSPVPLPGICPSRATGEVNSPQRRERRVQGGKGAALINAVAGYPTSLRRAPREGGEAGRGGLHVMKSLS